VVHGESDVLAYIGLRACDRILAQRKEIVENVSLKTNSL
jgi:hypothetical protein